MSGRHERQWPAIVRNAVHEALGRERGDYWLTTPNRSFNCLAPAELIEDPIGAQMVLAELRDLIGESRPPRPRAPEPTPDGG